MRPAARQVTRRYRVRAPRSGRSLDLDVIAKPAVEVVVAGATDQDVLAVAAEQRVVAGAADQKVVARAAIRGEADAAGGQPGRDDDVPARARSDRQLVRRPGAPHPYGC